MNFENELNKIKQSIGKSKLNESPVKFCDLSINHLYFIDEDQTMINNNGTLSKKYIISHRIALKSRLEGTYYINPSDMVKMLNKELKQAKDKKLIVLHTKAMYDAENNELLPMESDEILNSEDITLNQPKEYKKLFEITKDLSNG